MPPNIAFEHVRIVEAKEGDTLHVTGFSPDGLGVNVVHRHVAISRGGAVAHGATDDGLQAWNAVIPLPEGFTPGAAIAIGIETHLVLCTQHPMFATLTWSEDVTVT